MDMPVLFRWFAKGKLLLEASGGTEPCKIGERADGLYLVNHDRRLAIGAAKLLPVRPIHPARGNCSPATGGYLARAGTGSRSGSPGRNSDSTARCHSSVGQ